LKVATELLLFKNGQESIDYLDSGLQSLPKLIFLDLNMPIKNGMECRKYIRNNVIFNDIFVAIYATSSSDQDMEETLLNGANIYIQKPNDFFTLTKVVDRAVQVCLQYDTSSLDRKNFVLKL
jgi:CheY-like chemotaxis protein